MKPINKLGKKTSTIMIYQLITLSTIIHPKLANAAGILGNLDFDTIITNISNLLLPLTQLTLAICFVAGVFFILKGVAMLHTFGQMQQQMHRPQELSGPFIYILIGAALIYIPTSVSAVSNTIFGNTLNTLFSPSDQITFSTPDGGSYTITNTPNYENEGANKLLAYFDVGSGQEWNNLLNVIVKFIQFVGLIAFIRGFFLLSHLANSSGAQQNSFSKGLIHIIGGIVCINFIPFMQAISLMVFSKI